MAVAPPGHGAGARVAAAVATVVPDVSGIDREFDYEVPEALSATIEVGTVVRVALRHRRVRGWVVARSDARDDRQLLPVLEVVSLGPAADVVELARYGAWRYAGRLRPLLAAASPPRVVRELPPSGAAARPADRQGPASGGGSADGGDGIERAVREALAEGTSVLRIPPAAPRLSVVEAVLAEVASGGATREGAARPTSASALVLVPERHDAELLVRRLRRLGHEVAAWPEQWSLAAAGGRVVVGTRTAALATVPDLAVVVVLDAHDESYVEQRAPTWSAPVLLAERARRGKVPCVLVSACPTLEHLALGRLVRPARALERAGWPPLEVVDRRGEDPRTGRYSPRLAPLLLAALDGHPELPAICVLDRSGRVRLLACGSCGELTRCPECSAPLVQRARAEPGSAGVLACPSCGTERAAICPSCGSTRLRVLRAGVGRVAEELAALTGRPVTEVSGRAATARSPAPSRGLVVGTQAVLHRERSASVVVFLDFDQELLAPRYRAGEQALALLARAARLVGAVPARSAGPRPRVVVQTRIPGHEVLEAALRADPDLLAVPELARREALRLPPARALASFSGDGADGLAEELRRAGGGAVELGALPGRYLARAATSEALADALRAARERGFDSRVVVDPLDA